MSVHFYDPPDLGEPLCHGRTTSQPFTITSSRALVTCQTCLKKLHAQDQAHAAAVAAQPRECPKA